MRVDVSAIDEGQWVKSSAFPDVEWLVRGTEYPPYASAIRRAVQRALTRARGRRGNLDTLETTDPERRRLVAKHLLIGWKGIQDERGDDLPYTPEMAELFVCSREWVDAQRDIDEAIDKVGRDLEQMREEVAGN
jgi:hypothetical protein